MTSSRLLRISNPKARKAHRCATCRGSVQPGESYLRLTYAEYRRIFEWIECGPCWRDKIADYVWDWCTGDYWDADIAHEWACEMVIHGDPDEQRAAKHFLERGADR